jgi:hypothetical protein
MPEQVFSMRPGEISFIIKAFDSPRHSLFPATKTERPKLIPLFLFECQLAGAMMME